MHATFSLADYPFDRQQLQIRFEHGNLEVDALVFDPDLPSYERSGVPAGRWGLSAAVAVPEYEIITTKWSALGSPYETDFGNPFYSKPRSVYATALYTIDIARSFWPYCYKILIPLAVILAIAYLVFFIPPTEIQTATGLAMTALLTCVAMNLTVSGNLPDVGYLVASDKFFIGSYLLVLVTLAETVWTYQMTLSGQHARAARTELNFRWGFPIVVVVGAAVLAATSIA